MQWDVGLEGLSVMAAMSLGFGVLAALLVGGGGRRRLWAGVVDTLACFGAGLLVSEWMFGWADEEELQPNVDGLSRDEALLAAVITTVLVVVVVRRMAHRGQGAPAEGRHVAGKRHHLIGRR